MQTSIIIPTYNGAKYLGATIESVLAQTVQDWELIVVDDGSKDDTPAIAARYAARDSRIRVARQANGNVAAARNLGLTLADPLSRYIAFLDHDDLWEPDSLATLTTLLDSQPDMAGAHGLARFIDGAGDPCREGEAEKWTRDRQGAVNGKLVAWPLEWPTTFAVLAVVNRIYTPGQAIIRRSALELIGPLDSETAPCDDYDLWLRLTQHGDLAFVNRVVLGFRQHDSNTSKQASRMTQTEVVVRRKLVASPDASPEQRRVAGQGWQLWRQQMTALWLSWAKDSAAHRQWPRAAQQASQAARNYVQSFQR